MNITLKNNVVKEFDSALSAYEIAKTLGAGLAKAACACKINGRLADLRTLIDSDCELSILTFDDDEGKKVFWHTAAHILAQAVKRLYPKTALAIGPAVANGFYYDFEPEQPFNNDDLQKIENEMKSIIKQNAQLVQYNLSHEDAVKLFPDEPYKLELCNEHADETLSFYKQDDFSDLCAGPHLMFTGAVKAVKLTGCTGAYWRGDEKNKMLNRIYGTAFPKASQLQEHLEKLEEAKKRDHNKIGRELEFFTTCDLIGQGLPILLPKGARVVQLLQRFVEDEEERRGYQLTKTPLLAKSDIYKLSGHWQHYYDGMFVLGDKEKDETGDEVLALRPMTCPFQFQAYLNRARSYRDLPLRYNETSTLFRNEASGEMHGLIRVRQFTISEGHLACLPEQTEEEFRACFELSKFMLEAVGLEEDVSYRFSKWDENKPEKYMGSKENWENTQELMRRVLDNIGVKYTQAVGEAAFYGPKLDIQIKNVYGKEDTLITIQIDFQLAAEFGMSYTDKDNQKRHPIVIHRTSIGCYERTLALLIEKYAGALPLWLAPTQVRILPIADRHNEFCHTVLTKLRECKIRAEIDTRSEKIGFKIRDAQLQKIPYMLVIGDDEQERGKIAVRSRHGGDEGASFIDSFCEKLMHEVEARIRHIPKNS